MMAQVIEFTSHDNPNILAQFDALIVGTLNLLVLCLPVRLKSVAAWIRSIDMQLLVDVS